MSHSVIIDRRGRAVGEMTLKVAKEITGSLGYPSKMPGTAYGISAHACKTGSKLAAIEGTTCHDCYALKANYEYPSVAKSHETRLAGLTNPQWVPAMVKMLTVAHKRGTGKHG